jgi:Tfp pilus assembly protein PilO
MKFFAPIIVVAVAIGMYFFYIDTALPEIQALREEKAKYDEVMQKAVELGVLRDKILKEYSDVSVDDSERLNKLIPEKFNAVLFANDINTMILDNDLSVKDFKTNSQKTEDRSMITSDEQDIPYVTNVVTFRVIGDYDKFIKFLKEIESSLRLIDVVKLSIKNTGGTKTTDNFLDFALEVNTYSLR